MCGAGIAGIAAAWELAVQHGLQDVLLVDAGAPLSLTSDKSTECYRNWWPGSPPEMTAYMNRGIDRLEALAGATGNRFLLERRGYLFASADPAKGDAFIAEAEAASERGAGPLRIHRGAGRYVAADANGFAEQPGGADVLLDRAQIRALFPYLSPDTCAVLHARRCGGLSAQQLGMTLLDAARENGARFASARVVGVEHSAGRVSGVRLSATEGEVLVATDTFINAAGPHLASVGAMLGERMPVVCERHVKLTIDDREGVVPRSAPLLLWMDDVSLPWSPDDAEALAADDTTRYLVQPFPAGVHGRPLGRASTLALYWTWDCEVESPRFPVEGTAATAEINLRGMSVMVPALSRYFSHMPNACMDGGYYTKTADNRPLIGATATPGAFVTGGFSGFGIMASLAGAELLAAAVTGTTPPAYAGAFDPLRFDNPDYAASAVGAGQL